MQKHAWIVEVLKDIISYSEENKLSEVADTLEAVAARIETQIGVAELRSTSRSLQLVAVL